MPDPGADAAVRVGCRPAGATVRDWSSYARDGVFGGGAAAYLATGPTGTSADITGPRYLRTPATTLGFLREATWAADIKINAGTTYRRIWDWKTASGGDDVGFLIDLTPTGQVRIITSGRGVTTNAVPPTGRFINLVITAGRDGNLDVYVDGARIGGGTLAGPRHQRLRRRPSCASAPTRAAGSASAPSSTAPRCSPRSCAPPTARAGSRWRSSSGDVPAGPGRRHGAAGPRARRSSSATRASGPSPRA